jgi:predicted GNAT family acetyltransferase
VTTAHPLDRPVWHSLVGRWAPIASGGPRARRLDPDIGPFAAAADPRDGAALAALVPATGELWVVEAEALKAPTDVVTDRRLKLHQMVAEAVAPPDATFDIVTLGPADAAEMRALATLTQPGPWAARTHELGGFVGVRVDGRLAAMAGERMKPPGFTEVSGVCTHPDHRGRGYAGQLMRAVAMRILAGGEQPFLHVYPSNAGAIALYEALGFRLRRPISMTVLRVETR